MTLREFLMKCRKMIDENPESLDMEMITVHGASGATEELGSPYIEEISDWDEGEFPIRDFLPKDYPFDKIVWIYIGN